MTHARRIFIIAPCTALLLCACTVGPVFKSPTAPAVDRYTDTALPTATATASGPGGDAQHFAAGASIPSRWWTSFGSQRIDALVDTAFAGSPTIDEAQANLRQAQEQYNAVWAGLFPVIDGNASVTRQKVSGASYQGAPSIFTLYDASVNLSYGIDLFGGVRKEEELQQAWLDNQRYELQATYQTLAANVVTTAIAEASLNEQIAATTDIVEALRRQLAIAEKRQQLGGIALSEVLDARSNLAAQEAALPGLRKQLAQTRHRLAVYLGKTPAEFSGSELRLDALTLPAELPVSLPSELVQQRPDVRAAEAKWHQACANVGLATIAMLPHLSINASYGDESARTSDLFSNGIWGVGANLAQPLFHAGELSAKKRAAVAAYDAAGAQYRSTVLHAFEEVADALRAIQADAEALDAQSRSESSKQTALQLAEKQLSTGSISPLQLLDAQRQYQQARIGYVQALAKRYQDTAALFQALGGGAEALPAQAQAARAAP
jgi:NodT family efflux transporter outer membrane factor (OMF) lipoprotein